MERRLAAILAADMVGYTRLMRADEAGTLRRLTALREGVLAPLIADHQGRIVKLRGDGLLVEQDRAIIARLGEGRWLRLKPRDVVACLRLRYHAGILHWSVRFAEETLLVALDGSRQAYLDRLAEFIERGDVEVCHDE